MEQTNLQISQILQPALNVQIVQNNAPIMEARIIVGGDEIPQTVFGDTMTGTGTPTDPVNVSSDILNNISDNTQAIEENASEIQDLQNTARELNRDIAEIQSVIPTTANPGNQLADQGFVNSSIQTATAYFRGDWPTWADVPTNPALYPADATENRTPITNDYMVVIADEQENGGTWRYKYTGVWAEQGKSGWIPEYQINETPLTAAQLAAINSGVTATTVADVAAMKTGKQNKLTAGSNINITDNVISAVLTDYVKNTDYATASKAGVIGVGTYYACGATQTGYLYAITQTLDKYNSVNINSFISKGTLENIKDDYVKRGITENAITLTDTEKAAARTWIGAISYTDYATPSSAGLIRPASYYGTAMSSSGGYLIASTKSLNGYSTLDNAAFISKGTLENIKYDIVKQGITASTIELTDDEKAAAQAWLGIDTLIGDIETALAGV